MKKLVSIFLIIACACSVLLCGCTKANSATFADIVNLYQDMANANNENSANNIFYNGNVVENGAHFKITFNNQNLNNYIAQVNIANYNGDELTKYQRYALLSTLTSAQGAYTILLNALWNNFYFCCDRDVLDNPELNDIVPQGVKTNLYNNLMEVNNSLKAIKEARRTLESTADGSTFGPISAPVQNALTNLFLKINNLLIQSLNFNLEFENAMNYGNGEPLLENLPQEIAAGSLKTVLDKLPLRISQFFVYNNIIAGEGLENLSNEEKSFLNNFKSFALQYESAISRTNISKFETFTGSDISSSINIKYTQMRNYENMFYNQLPTFIDSANNIKSANDLQKTYYQQNINNFKNVAKTYLNYGLNLLNDIVA